MSKNLCIIKDSAQVKELIIERIRLLDLPVSHISEVVGIKKEQLKYFLQRQKTDITQTQIIELAGLCGINIRIKIDLIPADKEIKKKLQKLYNNGKISG